MRAQTERRRRGAGQSPGLRRTKLVLDGGSSDMAGLHYGTVLTQTPPTTHHESPSCVQHVQVHTPTPTDPHCNKCIDSSEHPIRTDWTAPFREAAWAPSNECAGESPLAGLFLAGPTRPLSLVANERAHPVNPSPTNQLHTHTDCRRGERMGDISHEAVGRGGHVMRLPLPLPPTTTILPGPRKQPASQARRPRKVTYPFPTRLARCGAHLAHGTASAS